MLHDDVLPVVREEQQFFYTCGAACINIVLSHWGKNRVQLTVWQDIQANTGTINRPGDAQSDAGSFATQYCDLCSPAITTGADGKQYGDYNCWYTTPEAMAATLNASSPVPVTVDYIADGADAIRRLAESIATFDVPAVFTTLPALHWVVAYGYQYDDVMPPAPVPPLWNSQYITGIYVHNPTLTAAPAGPQTVQMVTPHGLSGLLMSIQCGTPTRVGQHPVVGGAAAIAGGGSGTGGNGGGGSGGGPGGGSSGPQPVVGWWVIFLATVFIWLDPRRWIRYFFRPRRPGPPPR